MHWSSCSYNQGYDSSSQSFYNRHLKQRPHTCYGWNTGYLCNNSAPLLWCSRRATCHLPAGCSSAVHPAVRPTAGGLGLWWVGPHRVGGLEEPAWHQLRWECERRSYTWNLRGQLSFLEWENKGWCDGVAVVCCLLQNDAHRRNIWEENKRMIDDNNNRFFMGMRPFTMAMNKYGDLVSIPLSVIIIWHIMLHLKSLELPFEGVYSRTFSNNLYLFPPNPFKYHTLSSAIYLILMEDVDPCVFLPQELLCECWAMDQQLKSLPLSFYRPDKNTRFCKDQSLMPTMWSGARPCLPESCGTMH